MTKINKAQARKLFNAGRDVVAIPCKMDPCNQFWAMGAVLNQDMGTDFDKACNQLEYYNCSSETGRYLAFYHE